MNPRAMLKLSNFLNSRNKVFQNGLLGENVGIPFRFMSSAGVSTAARQSYAADGKVSNRYNADYAIFKGKAALIAGPVLPTYSTTDSGYAKIDRRGTVMLKFLPAIGERKYDYENKQLFALSATEVGSFISLGPGQSCEFFHDPSMKSSNAGQVRKSLAIKPIDDGYFISLTVTNNTLKSNVRLTVPVTTAEFAVMRAAFTFALPHIMGWVHYTNSHLSNVDLDSSKMPQQQRSSEWDR